MTNTPNQDIERQRVHLRLAIEVLEWVDELAKPGGPWLGISQAAEIAVARKRAERDFVRAWCKAQKVPFTESAFWGLFGPAVVESKPTPVGRPYESHTEREKAPVSLAAELLPFIEAACAPKGPLDSPSHVVEASLRDLKGLRRPSIAGQGFPFDGEALVARYAKAVTA